MKNQVKISLGTAICILIIIALLLIAGICCYNLLNKNNESKEVASNANVTNVEFVTEKEAEEMSLDDETVQTLYSYVNGAQNSFYKYGTVNKSTIDNDLVLKLAYNYLANTNENLYKQEEDYVPEGVEKYTGDYIEKDLIAEGVSTVFGKEINYKDEEFYIRDVTIMQSKRSEYESEKLSYNSEKENYELISFDSELYTDIKEIVEKALKYNDKIEIYVKPIFWYCDMANEINTTDLDHVYTYLYKSFDYDNSEFINEIGILKDEDIYEMKEEDLISEINSDELDTYKYTFELDESTGNYYFSSFEKVQ